MTTTSRPGLRGQLSHCGREHALMTAENSLYRQRSSEEDRWWASNATTVAYDVVDWQLMDP